MHLSLLSSQDKGIFFLLLQHCMCVADEISNMSTIQAEKKTKSLAKFRARSGALTKNGATNWSNKHSAKNCLYVLLTYELQFNRFVLLLCSNLMDSVA